MRRNSRTGVYAILESLLKRRWFLCILRQLGEGQASIEVIGRAAPEMPVHVMNGRLRTLLRYGLVSRCSRQMGVQSVEYRLTPFGRKITEILDKVSELDQEFGSVLDASVGPKDASGLHEADTGDGPGGSVGSELMSENDSGGGQQAGGAQAGFVTPELRRRNMMTTPDN